jgi:hypothetical protein
MSMGPPLDPLDPPDVLPVGVTPLLELVGVPELLGLPELLVTPELLAVPGSPPSSPALPVAGGAPSVM